MFGIATLREAAARLRSVAMTVLTLSVRQSQFLLMQHMSKWIIHTNKSASLSFLLHLRNGGFFNGKQQKEPFGSILYFKHSLVPAINISSLPPLYYPILTFKDSLLQLNKIHKWINTYI